jgi:ubiquitin-associated SH3 domain-containing protein
LTLAYQFPSEAYHDLAELVEELDTSKAHSWELRLYSRDPRLATKQVNKVIFPHTSRELDELNLNVGDYIFINSDAAQNSADGWTEGICFSTNNLGFFPLNYTERTSETNVWTLNETVNLCQGSSDDDDGIDAVDGISNATESGEYFVTQSFK